jgi:hypothetical protein
VSTRELTEFTCDGCLKVAPVLQLHADHYPDGWARTAGGADMCDECDAAVKGALEERRRLESSRVPSVLRVPPLAGTYHFKPVIQPSPDPAT